MDKLQFLVLISVYSSNSLPVPRLHSSQPVEWRRNAACGGRIARIASPVIARIARSGRSLMVRRRGRPVAAAPAMAQHRGTTINFYKES